MADTKNIFSVDDFDVPTSANKGNVLDIASHYEYSPERWRLFADGSAVHPEYGSVSQYNHAGPYHELIPAQGETVVMQTAERPRYVVGYVLKATFAMNTSRALESGDVVRGGLFDDTDGWYLEFNGDDAPDEVRLVVLEAGSATEKTVELDKPITTFCRYALKTSWYRVGPQNWFQSYSVGPEMAVGYLGGTSESVIGGPEVGNLPVRFEVTRGASASALTLQAGSASVYNFGRPTPFVRRKSYDIRITTPATAGTWFPLYALRIDPDRYIINASIDSMEVLSYSGANDVECTLKSMAPENVHKSGGVQLEDSDFIVPPEMSPTGSVLEHTDPSNNPITEAYDRAGTFQASTDTPGGFQIAHASSFSSGQGSKTSRGGTNTFQKRSLLSGDYGVLWVKTEVDTSEEAVIEIATEQEW